MADDQNPVETGRHRGRRSKPRRDRLPIVLSALALATSMLALMAALLTPAAPLLQPVRDLAAHVGRSTEHADKASGAADAAKESDSKEKPAAKEYAPAEGSQLEADWGIGSPREHIRFASLKQVEHKGKTLAMLTYEDTNITQDNTGLQAGMTAEAYQNGVKLDNASILPADPSKPDGWVDDRMPSVQPGTTVTLTRVFELTDPSAPVTIELDTNLTGRISVQYSL